MTLKFEPSFHKQEHFFQSPSIQLSGRQAPPGGTQGILYYLFPFWDPRFSLPLCHKLCQIKISVSYVLCQFLTNSRKIIVSLFFSTKLKHFQFWLIYRKDVIKYLLKVLSVYKVHLTDISPWAKDFWKQLWAAYLFFLSTWKTFSLSLSSCSGLLLVKGCLPSPGAHEPAYLYMIAKLKKNSLLVELSYHQKI